ncbi:hypothetical protein Psch_03677 [Pelotomaculum schinkii]|uniref:Uncharacterized protein n=1 Tax=Pelotomaculum schinkii TaxID=78350 RepID=A0A4Y7R7H6_9FIRM|nr:hypothetical protein [Pelotomaculum schinkii]TEB04914.1 hypothetical protein Psch_03677 [Pelotomaculum schinkii]
MKIGAGGLQAMAAQEVSRALNAGGPKPTVEEALLQGEDLAMRRMRYELNQAVERMRRAAEFYNQPLDFKVQKDKPKIKARDRRSGAGREFTLEEAEAWLAELYENKGRNLNGYA